MRRPGVLITGASGEIGHGLISRLAAEGSRTIVTLDVRALEPALGKMVQREVIGSITDASALDRILAEFDIDHVYHLAAYLSTRSEFTPVTAHQVNVEGTMNLLEFAQKQGESHGRPVVFLYPSSIAAYGLPDLETKAKAAKVREEEFNTPTTMYGCNKLYCELLGRYYARHYKQLSAEPLSGKVDFRAVRFPGADLGCDGTLRRHLRLRAGDDSCRRQGRGVRLLCPARHADPVHGDAGRRRSLAQAGVRAAGAAVEDRLQRRRLQSLG